MNQDIENKDEELNEFDEVGFSHLDDASMTFLKSIKLHYNRNTAVDVMNALQPIMGKAWSGRLLFNLLAENDAPPSGYIKIKAPITTYKKIQAIKMVRSLSGCSLTDAKNLVEQSAITPQLVKVDHSRADSQGWFTSQVYDLRDAGLVVSTG